MTKFKKDDSGKVQLAHLPFAQLEIVARVLDHGAEKYGRDNWKEGNFIVYASACLRHIFARLKGEHADPQSSLPHLAHAACCILFMMWHDGEE